MIKNDQQKFEQLLKGDEASFKVLYNYFYPRLFYFVSEYIFQEDSIQDIIQDTFYTLWKKRKALRSDTNLNAWLYTVAKNNCLKKLRDEKYRKEIFKSVHIADFELELNIGALTRLDTSEFSFFEIKDLIQDTLNNLPIQCKAVFEKSRFENMKNREIAEELHISVKTVEGHITKAIKSFKVALKDYLPIVYFLVV